MPESGEPNLLEEWKHARDVLKTCDDRIHDLRKYGFSFVTGLMTLEGIFIPYVTATASESGSGIPDGAKLAIIGATLGLVIILRWFDQYYHGFLYGAALRARIIERFLNYELTDQIALRFRTDKLWFAGVLLYLGFEAAVLGLGFGILSDSPLWVASLIIPIIIDLLVFYRIYNPRARRSGVLAGPYSMTDWAVDRLICRRKEQVRIMLTNLTGKDLDLFEGQNYWRIIDSEGNERGLGNIPATVRIPSESCYEWSWIVPENASLGIHRILVKAASEERELARKLIVVETEKKEDKVDAGKRKAAAQQAKSA